VEDVCQRIEGAWRGTCGERTLKELLEGGEKG
jgi:hypothetical protein